MKTFTTIFFHVALFSLNNQVTFSQTVYNINDPRNPQCPCHNYQKIADEEYKSLLVKANKSEKVNSSEKRSGFQLQTNRLMLSNIDKLNQNKNANYKKYNWRKKEKLKMKWRAMKTVKQWNFWKRLPKSDACTHW